MPRTAASDTHRLVARTIVQHLLDQDAQAGAPVSEAGLAEVIGVSRSPVRGALRLLEQDGVIVRGENRRYSLIRLPMPEELMTASAEQGAEAERLYWRIAADRLAQAIGTTAAEAELMRRYDVSRSLLQRTMRQVASEGWAEPLPTGVWRFLPLIDGSASYDESYRFRLAIEPPALLEPGFHLPPAIANRLRREQTYLLDDGVNADPRRVFEYNSGFHLSLMQASNNRFFAEAALRVTRLRRVVGYVIALDRSRTPTQSEEHLAILERIQDDDIPAAARLLAEHLKAGQMSKRTLLADRTLTVTGPTEEA